jgi:hypothetical protein
MQAKVMQQLAKMHSGLNKGAASDSKVHQGAKANRKPVAANEPGIAKL